MKKLLKLFIVLIGINFHAQEVKFSAGTNYTDYSFYANDNFSASGIGSFFEIEYIRKLGKKTFKSLSHSISLNLNEYNASTGNMASYYEWQTSYVGIKNSINLPLYTTKNGIQFYFSAGVNLSHIIKGNQKINSMVYDISDHNDFKGIVIWSDLGFNVSYKIKDDIKLAVGYSMSENQTFNGTRTSIIYNEESPIVYIDNHQINLSLIYTLND